MIFELNEEQKLVQDTAKQFAADDIAPTLEEEERNQEFRVERVRRMGELGFFSCALPEELGGSGLGFLESVLMAEQIAKVSASWRLPFNMQNLGPLIDGREVRHPRSRRKKFVPGWVRGNTNRLFCHDGARQRLGCREHEDRRP